MKTFTRGRVLAALALSSLGIFTIGVTGASAAPTTSSSVTGPYIGQPEGCTPGYFCSYNSGNGGNLCFQTNYSMNFPTGCADQNDGAFNYSSVPVNLYWGFNDYGAYYVLPAGHYLLDMTQDYFDKCPSGGTSCAGYGQPMYDNVEAVLFT